MSAITLKDVAQVAGVSMKTVSRVINNSPDVAEETRLHVERVIKSLNYQPNRLARSLASGKTNTIGVIIHHTVHQIFYYPFFSELLGGISACLNQNKLDLLLHFKDNDTPYTELYDQHRVDGLIVTNPPINNPSIHELIDNTIPCVFTSRIALEANASHWVDSNFYQGIHHATRHLLTLGHRRIAINLGPCDLALSHLRANGYRDALLSENVPLDESLMVYGELFLENGCIGEKLLDNWLNQEHPPTAIIASDDLGAINTIKALTQLGYHVPEDMSVIGVDDTALARFVTPQLTSVQQRAYEKGYTAANTLLQIINGATQSPMQIKLEMELVVRDSTGPAPV